MDPDANLKEQREIAARILKNGGVSSMEECDRLAELVIALDEWVAKGGFLPAAWRE